MLSHYINNMEKELVIVNRNKNGKLYISLSETVIQMLYKQSGIKSKKKRLIKKVVVKAFIQLLKDYINNNKDIDV